MTTAQKQTHSPAPWKIVYNTDYLYEPEPEDLENRYILSIEDSEGKAVCYTDSGYFKIPEANGHLIAVAPELLDALIRLTNLVTGNGIPSDQYSIASELSINPQSLEAVKLAEKAIAKAEEI